MTKADIKEVLHQYLLHIRDYGVQPYEPDGHLYFTFYDLHKGAEEFLNQFEDDNSG